MGSGRSVKGRGLESLMRPGGVCIVGASGDPARLAGRPLRRLTQHAFAGRIALVNPKCREIEGYPCYATVSDLPEPVDVALVVRPAETVPDMITECGRRGIRHVVVLSSGFEEDPAGADTARRLRAAIGESGVNVVGPNCEGIWSIPSRLALTFGTAADRPQLHEGGVSIISQSGSIGGACMRKLQDRAIGCRYFVSTGNETDLTAMDFLEFMIDDGGSRVIGLFVEALSDGWRLRPLAALAKKKGIRIVALRAGSSDEGRAATASHTGKIATAARVYADVFRQCGVVEVETLSDLIDAIDVADVENGGVPSPRSDVGVSGIGVIAISGGSRSLIADACAKRAVPLARFSPHTEDRLRELLPRFGYAKNPADVTGEILSDPTIFLNAVTTVANDEHTDALVIQYANAAGRHLEHHLGMLSELRRASGKPIVVSLLGDESPELGRKLRAQGVLCAGDPDKAVTYLGWLYRFAGSAAGASARGEHGPHDALDDDPGDLAPDGDLLRRCGIALPRTTIVGGDSDLRQAVRELEFPVVAKALSEQAAHKTERGLVELDLRNVHELDAAVMRLRTLLGTDAPIMVQEMVKGGQEVLLAVRHDPDFGPVLALGFGGTLTEWVADVAYVPLPASEEEILRALQGLRLWPLLQPFRGRARRDVEALVNAAMRLGLAFQSLGDDDFELEVNPLLVLEEGRGVVAVDVLAGSRALTERPVEAAT